MRVLYALTCEHAQDRQDGRLDVHGVFHQLYAPGFPAQQDRMTLALAVEWGPEERGRIEFRVDLLDPGASPVFSITGHTEVGEQEPLMGPPQTRLLMPLQDVVFPAEGAYEFQLEVAGEKVRLAPMRLFQTPRE